MPLKIADCNLDEVLMTTVNELKKIYGNRFHVESSQTIEGRWDSSCLKRVIENLAGNAVKYGVDNGPVDIRLREKGEWIELVVHNEGNPIEVKDQSTLFAAYHRSNSASVGKHKGWGIGLTFVKDVTESHGGAVRVESDSINGTTFVVTLPYKDN